MAKKALDLNKTGKISKFSEESKKLITDMGNNEIFEFCETSYKKQCPDCNLHWEIGIVYCSCGRCLTPSQSTLNSSTSGTSTPYQFQVTSSKRTYSVVPNMELPNGIECTTKPRTCRRKLANLSIWWVQNHFGNMAQR